MIKVEIDCVSKNFKLGIAKLAQDNLIENEHTILQLDVLSELLQSD